MPASSCKWTPNSSSASSTAILKSMTSGWGSISYKFGISRWTTVPLPLSTSTAKPTPPPTAWSTPRWTRRRIGCYNHIMDKEKPAIPNESKARWAEEAAPIQETFRQFTEALKVGYSEAAADYLNGKISKEE